MTAALTLERISVERGGRIVLHPLSFSVDAGSVLAILGPNGAGKTTLLDAIAGVIPSNGTLRVFGEPLPADQRARARRIACVPQVTMLDSPMLVQDVVEHGRFAHRDLLQGRNAVDEAAITRALEATNTARFRKRPFTALSHGERRRVLVARALATEAPILLLDEPSAALDISQTLVLFQLLRELASAGRCIVVVLHALDEAFRCADRALLLCDGTCAALGPTPEVIAKETVKRVFGVELIPGAGFGYGPLSGAA